jgi:anti-anti-sigma regulatory factor
LEQNESYALIDWNSNNLIQSNYEELENLIRILFKKEYTNIILNISKVEEIDGYGVSAIRKGTKICVNENGLLVVVNKKDEIVERLDAANIEGLTLLNTIQEGVDAIYLNDLENDFGADEESDEYSSDGYSEEDY